MQKVKEIINPYGVVMIVKLIEKGDTYGLNNSVMHDKWDPIVEFRLSSGYTISSYYLSTLKETENGIWLDASNDTWVVDKENIQEVLTWINDIVK